MKNWWLFLVSVVVAFLIWVLHNLSLDYSANLQYRVFVETNIEGFSPKSVAHEPLLLRGKATGFYILRARRFHNEPAPLRLTIDAKFFSPADENNSVFADEAGNFILKVSDVRDRITEALGGWFDIDFIETEDLTFTFRRDTYAKKPVFASMDISLKPQYMRVGKVILEPDSVIVYGTQRALDKLTHVSTKTISFSSLDKSVQGYVDLENVDGVRIDKNQIYYTIHVERYVEDRRTVPVQIKNVPAGKTIMALPSSIEVTYRAPFRPRGGRIDEDDISFVVDYNDFVGSASTKVIPKLVTDREIYSYRIEPSMIDCILVESR